MATSLESLARLPRPFGPFTLLQLIAQGGMGQVFLALRPVEGEAIDEVCVVKTVRTDLHNDREAVSRFLDEARLAQKLDHPAICHTLDAGIVDKTYFIALEFISGRNLRDAQLRAQKLGTPIPEAVIFRCLMECLRALDYAHALVNPRTGTSMRIVHRDVSPHNLMLGFDGNVKLIDFGLAEHELKREMTQPGIMVGKLRYNSPEQVRDRAFDGRSDLYSVGVILYELLSGERFYEGLSEDEIWRVAMTGVHQPRLLETLPADVQTVLELALHPEPRERFATAADMRDALAELARSRSLVDDRSAVARFMAEIFADERQKERDMILQATGIAETRTRLFEVAPTAATELAAVGAGGRRGASAERTEDGEEPGDLSSMGRTEVFSPARLRGQLAELVSSFDSSALTSPPSPPVGQENSQSGADAFAHSEPHRTDREKDAPREPGRPAHGAEGLVATVVYGSRHAPPARVSGPQRRIDTNLRPAVTAIPNRTPKENPEEQTASTSSLASSSETEFVRRTPADARRAPALILVGASLVVTVAIVLLAIVVLPRLNSGGKVSAHTSQKVGELDAGDSSARAAGSSGDQKSDPPDGSTEHDPEGSAATMSSPKQAGAEKRIAEGKRPPPPGELRSMRQQMEYLSKWCLDRVACARSIADNFKELATLPPE